MESSRPTRRNFLENTLVMAGTMSLPANLIKMFDPTKAIKLGLISDLHGGFAKDAGKRLDVFLGEMKESRCDALVQLGDFAFPNAQHQEFADKFNAAHPTTLHVIGNHEFDHGLSREDCYKAWKIDSSYYRRDVGSLRVLVLDGNETGSPTYDGGYHSYIGEQQQAWLEKELTESDKPVMILSHQPLAGVWPVDNAKQIQKLLTTHAKKIVICLNGHSHVDSLVEVGGVSYLHINSASYFWVGGNAKTAFYRDPLFTILTIDPAKASVTIKSRISAWRDKSPSELGYFKREGSPPERIVTPQIRARTVNKS